MAIQAQDLRGLITGTLKLIEPTDKRDSSKRVVWKAECCACGKHEYGTRPELEKFAGYTECPGHPCKVKKPVDGFRLHPDDLNTLEQQQALAAWQSRRHPEQPKVKKDRLLSTEENKALRGRLGLVGYKTETITLKNSLKISGCTAEKVVFATQLTGSDRVLLHVALVDAVGKRSIVSSKKKIAEDQWTLLSETLAGLQIKWRERESIKKAA
jgi:hypothetical protein